MSHLSKIPAIFLVVCFAFIFTAFQPAPPELVNKLESFYLSVKSFKADFVQEIHIANIQAARKSSGTVWFLKPKKMRWDYKSPKQKIVLFDGEYLWMYLPFEYQAQRQRATSAFESQLPLLFLEQKGSLSREFKVEQIRSSSETLLLKLIPKQKEPTLPKGIEIEVDQKTLLILKASFFDAQGNLNIFTFSEHEVNKDIPDAYFKLELGPDVQIVE